MLTRKTDEASRLTLALGGWSSQRPCRPPMFKARHKGS